MSLINVDGTGELRLFAHRLAEDHDIRAFSRIFHNFYGNSILRETEITYEEVSLINVDRTGELRLFAHRLAEDHDLFK